MLDANICIYVLDGAIPALRSRVEAAAPGTLVTSAVAFAEVMIGAGRRGAVSETLRLFEIVPVLAFDRAAGTQYAGLPFRRARFDRLIAAHALSLGLTLVTNNAADFAEIPELRVENWTQ